MSTTATFDHEADEFVIHSPNPGAFKNWISFAANHARGCVVFADLITGVKGKETSEGVHALYVPIRDSAGTIYPGVNITDMGHKPAINGNDNANISFDNVRVQGKTYSTNGAKLPVTGRTRGKSKIRESGF